MRSTRSLSALAAAAAAGMLAGALLVPHGMARAQDPGAFPGAGPAPGGGAVGPGPGQNWPGNQGWPGAGQGFPGRQPGMMPMQMSYAAITATAEHVYVLRGNTLYQFAAKDLKLLNKVTLEPEAPAMPGGMPGVFPGGPGAGMMGGGFPGGNR